MSDDRDQGDEEDGAAEPVRSEREIARELRLRPEGPRVTRLSRKVLIGLGATAAIAVLGATIFALQATRKSGPAQELYETQSKARADGLATLPKDYTGFMKGGAPRGVPALGPPLPGDLGRPIIAAQNGGPSLPGPPSASGTPARVDPQVQQQIETRESARLSKLFTDAGTRASPIGAADAAVAQATGDAPAGPGATAATALGTAEAAVRQTGQDHKLAFVEAATGKIAASPERLQPPASPYVVQAGTVIAGALVTGIRSDLPGEITGQVTQDVYDSPTGRYLLIPQGSKLIGAYDSQVAFGQSRVLMVWTRLILPNGKSMTLERQTGADPQGFSGLQDRVNDHWGQLLKGALLSTLLSVGAEAGTTSNENNLAQALRAGAAQSFSQTGEQIVARELNVQPTLTIRPGYPVTVIVGRDLVLEPYGA